MEDNDVTTMNKVCEEENIFVPTLGCLDIILGQECVVFVFVFKTRPHSVTPAVLELTVDST